MPVAVTPTSCQHTAPPFVYYNNDGDLCGDTYSLVSNPCGNQVLIDCVTLQPDPFGGCTLTLSQLTQVELLCIDTDFDEIVDASVCTSWDSSNLRACSSVLDAVPTTGSRCGCTNAVSVNGLIVAIFANGFE